MGKQEEIKKLIDKSIGTKGALDIPSFWMSKILKDVVDLSQENNKDDNDGRITIVDSVVKLDPNAELGSLASVVKQGSSKEISFRDLYQPDESMLDQNTGTITEPKLLSSVLSINVFAPLAEDIDRDQSYTYLNIIPRDDFSFTTSPAIEIVIVPFESVTANIYEGYYVTEALSLVVFSQDTNSFTIHSDQVDALNTLLANGMDWCYLGAPWDGLLTEEQLATIDLFFKAVTGSRNKANVYLKKDNWEELYAKDLDNLGNNITGKADKISINSYEQYWAARPNAYTTITFDSTSVQYINLSLVSDASIYNEYIMEIKCTAAPSAVNFYDHMGNILSINWANGNPPTFEEGYTYIISIANNFGVFAQFPNS